MIDDQIDDHPQSERLGVVDEADEVAERAVLLVDVVVVGDVVAVVAIRGWVEGLQPDAGDAEARQIVEPAHQPFEVADAVAVRVLILLDVQAVDDGVAVPEIVERHRIREQSAFPDPQSHQLGAARSRRGKTTSAHAIAIRMTDTRTAMSKGAAMPVRIALALR